MELNDNKTIFKPFAETVLTVAAGLSFYILCMILPLVGPAGSRAEHSEQNKATFLAVLLVTLSLAAVSVYARLGRRKTEECALPWCSIGLCTVCLLALITLLFNGFAI